MIRARSIALAAGIAATALAARAPAQTAAPRPAFKWERAIVTNGSGPRRLPVDVALLAGSSFNLSDLRLFDVNGKETPYLLVSPPPAAPTWTPATILNVAPVNTRGLKQSSFEADLGSLREVDRFRIDQVNAMSFLKRARLEASGDRAHWTLLVAEGTLFDLPDEQLRQTELAFTPGTYRYFRITWDDTNSARIPAPRLVAARIVPSAATARPLTASLSVERRPSEPGRSRYRVHLPAPHLPIVALAFDLGGGHIMRDVSVYEPRLVGAQAEPALLGSARLHRVVRGSLVAASLQVPITPPVEPQLDLVVDDGDNPPLLVQGISAVFAEQPWIYVESDGGALVARYGAERMKPPRYDLEAVRESLRTDINRVVTAEWSAAHAATADASVATEAPPTPTIGASVDGALFNYVRSLPEGDAGLVMVPLDAAVLSHSAGIAGTFADLRVIDGSDRQVPYLLESVSEPLTLDLRLTRLTEAPASLGGRSSKSSVYRIEWPFERLPPSRLVIDTSARVFERTASVGVERAPDKHHRDRWVQAFMRANWAHADQDLPAPSLSLPIATTNAKELLVIVEEGDNTPLPLTTARLLLPAFRVRFFRERGAALRLAYGSEALPPPRYDLALLAPQLLGVAATEIAAGGEQPGARSTAARPAVVSPRLFWAILALAVVVLLALIVRLLRKEQPV